MSSGFVLASVRPDYLFRVVYQWLVRVLCPRLGPGGGLPGCVTGKALPYRLLTKLNCVGVGRLVPGHVLQRLLRELVLPPGNILRHVPSAFFEKDGQKGDISGSDSADAAGLTQGGRSNGGEFLASFVPEATHIFVIQAVGYYF